MRFSISKLWCKNAAELEGNSDITINPMGGYENFYDNCDCHSEQINGVGKPCKKCGAGYGSCGAWSCREKGFSHLDGYCSFHYKEMINDSYEGE